MKFQNSTLRLNTFREMALSSVLMRGLEKMAITKPTDVQCRAIPEGLKGANLIVVAQTGSGKTLAFALPVLTFLERNPEARSLVLAPSREMAQQIHKVFLDLCAELPLSCSLVIGGIPSAKQSNALKKNPRLIIGTPGRLNDHLVGNKQLLQNVQYVVIDEADRMLDMGFAPQLENIQKTLRTKTQTLMFSASFNPTVEAIAQKFMSKPPLMIRSAQAEKPVASLTQKVLYIDKFAKNDRLLDELNATKGGVIVFCGNQGSCERMGQYLEEYGYSMGLIHGGQSQGHRNRVVRQFREGEIRIIVATDLLARGIDVPHVDHVINFDLPFQAEDFLHRIGRTARAGRSGHAITFVTSSDTKMYQKIKPYLQGAHEIKVTENFSFIERDFSGKSNRYKNKKLDPKKSFDGSKKTVNKPSSKTIGRLDKPNKHARTDGRVSKI
ncbi:MAG: DEAD/DEAH box helicase [Bdellovibrionaceae bacterium]|nr:DEAD/DEAH box helicase [Pseudobdellovibrionaceae bacterium]